MDLRLEALGQRLTDVDVDVGKSLAVLVQETLVWKAVGNRVDPGDVEREAEQRVDAASATIADRDGQRARLRGWPGIGAVERALEPLGID